MGDNIKDVVDDGQDGMQCNNHPYGNNGGICALCLQEKLGKLITSSTLSFDATVTGDGKNHRPSSDPPPPPSLQQHRSSSSSPSITIEPTRTASDSMAPMLNLPRLKHLSPPPPFFSSSSSSSCNNDANRKQLSVTIIPSHTGNQKAPSSSAEKIIVAGEAKAEAAAAFALKRSKSVAARRDTEESPSENTPRRSFWSFLYFAKKRGRDRECSRRRWHAVEEEGEEEVAAVSGSVRRSGGCGDGLSHQQQERRNWGLAAAGSSGNKENESPNSSNASSAASFGRKVARSRSVGCGSRSFSGDFLERISNGFADCTLRRVESHREAKAANKIVLHGTPSASAEAAAGGIKESVKCGGIFGGFGIYSSSFYWLSDDFKDSAAYGGTLSSGSDAPPPRPHHAHHRGGGRNRSWSWAFASPMRAFSRPSRSSSQTQVGGVGLDQHHP